MDDQIDGKKEEVDDGDEDHPRQAQRHARSQLEAVDLRAVFHREFHHVPNEDKG